MMDTNCRIKFIDDGTEMDVIIHSSHDEVPYDELVFFYGMSREDCIRAMENKELCENEWMIVEVY